MRTIGLLLIALGTIGMGWNPGKPDPEPPPVIEKPTKLLTNYYWGTSDEVVPGHAILMPHASLTGNILNAQVNDEQLTFKQVYGNGQEIWSAGRNAEFYGNANLTVETNDSIYKSIIQGAPDEHDPPPTNGTVEQMTHSGFTNGDRSTWYGAKKMSEYPSPLRVQIDGCVDISISHNGHRYESGGLLVKQSDVYGRGIAVLVERSCRSKVARLVY